MPTFLVEVYMPRLRAGEVEKAAEQARRRRRRASSLGLRCVLPALDLRSRRRDLFHLFEAASAETVRVAGRFAGLAFDRITEPVESSQLRRRREMKRMIVIGATLAALVAPIGNASAGPNEGAGCVGAFSSFFAHNGFDMHRSSGAELRAEPPSGRPQRVQPRRAVPRLSRRVLRPDERLGNGPEHDAAGVPCCRPRRL